MKTPDNEQWSEFDEIAANALYEIELIDRLSDFNALIFFADQLIEAHEEKEVTLDEHDLITLHQFIDAALPVETILQKHLGINYVNDYIEAIEMEEEDD